MAHRPIEDLFMDTHDQLGSAIQKIDRLQSDNLWLGETTKAQRSCISEQKILIAAQGALIKLQDVTITVALAVLLFAFITVAALRGQLEDAAVA